MITEKTEFNLVATVAAGLESLVGRELRQLNIDCHLENGRARFRGSLSAIAKTNLWLRSADRIKIVIGEFEAVTFAELFDKVKSLPWDDFLPLTAHFPVAGKSIKSKLFSVSDVQAITKKAIVEKLRETYHRPPKVPLPETGALYQLEVVLRKDQVLITLDTTGASLFKRGYRIEKGSAPLKENMAASLILFTNWKKNFPFYDPTCGSGTIAIEAALIGKNIAPGLQRTFACEEWDWFAKKIFDSERQFCEKAIDYDCELDILAADLDKKIVEVAKINAREAGVSDAIEFKQMRLEDFRTKKERGIILSNPPYGERLKDKKEILKLYQAMGEIYRELDTWSKYILTSERDFEKHYGQKATKKRKLYNGALRVDLFQYWGGK